MKQKFRLPPAVSPDWRLCQHNAPTWRNTLYEEESSCTTCGPGESNRLSSYRGPADDSQAVACSPVLIQSDSAALPFTCALANVSFDRFFCQKHVCVVLFPFWRSSRLIVLGRQIMANVSTNHTSAKSGACYSRDALRFSAMKPI